MIQASGYEIVGRWANIYFISVVKVMSENVIKSYLHLFEHPYGPQKITVVKMVKVE